MVQNLENGTFNLRLGFKIALLPLDAGHIMKLSGSSVGSMKYKYKNNIKKNIYIKASVYIT